MRKFIDYVLAFFHYRHIVSGRPVPKRICALCRQPIKRNHRWHLVGKNAQHWDCENPIEPPKTEKQAPAAKPDYEQCELEIPK